MNRKKSAILTARHSKAPAPATNENGARATRFLHQVQPVRGLTARRSRLLLPALLAVPAFGGALFSASSAQAAAQNTASTRRVPGKISVEKEPTLAKVAAAATAANVTAVAKMTVASDSSQTLISGARLAQAQTNTPAAAPAEPQKEPGAIITVDPNETKPPEAPAPNPPTDKGETAPAAPEVPVTPPQPDQTVVPPAGADTATPVIGSPAEAEGRAIAQVRVVGNRIVSDQTILLQATGTRAGAAYSTRQADLDRAKIDALGFFASVQQQVSPNLEDPAKVDVTFIVVENRTVTGFKFEGSVNVKTEDLMKVLTSQKGSVLNRNMVNADVEKIQNLYRDKGFVVLVNQTRQLEDGTLVFDLQEAKIARIDITGEKKTRPSLIRRQVRAKAGDVFDQVLIRKDLNRIYDMGFFEDVSYKVADDPDKPAQAIVTYIVKEKRTGQLSLGAGFDNRSRITGFGSVVDSNFKGTGKSISASAELGGSNARRSYSLGFADPFVGEHNAGYDLSIFQTTVFRSPRSVAIITGGGGGGGSTNKTINFEEQRTGLRFNFTQPLDDERSRNILFGLRNESAKLFQTDNTGTITPVTLPQNSSGRVFAPSIGVLIDKRDLRTDPSRGRRDQIILEKGFSALGGTASFTKLDLDVRRYLPLSGAPKVGELPRVVLANRFVYGRSFGNLPAFEQYFVGGSETVRGYDNDELYGDNQFYNNLELRFRFNRTFQFVGFTDVGRAFGGRFSSPNERTLFSVGVGIRLKTPIGPIRLDVGRGDRGIKTSFGIGPTF